MKARRPDTDQEAEFHVFKNGVQCSEYILPSAVSHDANLVVCFIEVKPDDELAVHGKFAGSVLHGAIDFVPDGTFAADARIEGTLGKIKYARLSKKFVKAMDCPKPPGWTSLIPPTKVQEGYLAVKTLGESAKAELSRHEIEDEEATSTGIGSIAIIVSVNQDVLNNYAVQGQYLSFGAWRETSQTKVRRGGVSPDTHIELEVTEDSINPKRSVKHRRHFAETRYGDKPWAKFIFYYRTKETLNAAGCIPRPQAVQELQPWDEMIDGEFVFADKNDRSKAARAKKAAEVEMAEQHEDDMNGSGSAGSPMFLTPAPTTPKPKKGRLGGMLKLQKDGRAEISPINADADGGAAITKAPTEPQEKATSPPIEQTLAPAATGGQEEDPTEATDDFFDDGEGLFVSTSDNEDPPNISRDNHGTDKTTNADMGGIMSSASGKGLDVAQVAEGEANISSPVADSANVNNSANITSGRSFAPAASRGNSAADTPRAEVNYQSPNDAQTTTNHPSTSLGFKSVLPTLDLPARTQQISNSPAEVETHLGEATAKDKAKEMEQTPRIAAPEVSHAKAETVTTSRPSSAPPLAPQGSRSEADIDRIPSIATIRATIPPEGLTVGQIAKIFNNHGPYLNVSEVKQTFHQRINEVAFCSGSDHRFYLKSAAAPAMPPTQTPAVKPEPIEDFLEHDTLPAGEGQETLLPSLQEVSSTQLPAEMNVTVTSNDRVANPPSKRLASAMSPSTSEQGTPAKRSRLEDLADRKAEVARSIEAKKARNAAKMKAVEAKRQAKVAAKREAEEAAKREREQAEAREAAAKKEQEEKEMKELEDMEAADAELDLDFSEMEEMELDIDYDDGGDQDET